MLVRLCAMRLMQFLLSLFFIVTVTFFMMKALPGDPFTEEQAIPQEILDSLYRHYGLDRPLFDQYLTFLKGVASCNLGPSLKYEGRYIHDVIAESFPISMSLGLSALIVSSFGGVLLGALSAHYHKRFAGSFLNVMMILGISIPGFLIATFLQYFLALKWSLFPLARWGTFSHMVLPVLSLSFLPMAYIARLARNQILEVMEQDYVTFAKSKGISSYKIMKDHVLKNALFPVITYIGHLSASILTGSFVIEKIFGIPGLGFWFVNSIANRDYTMIMGLTIFFSFIVTLMIFLVDMVYLVLDPKIAAKMKYEYERRP